MRKSSHRNTGRSNTGRKGGQLHDDSPIPKPVRPGESHDGGFDGAAQIPGVGKPKASDW